MLIPVGSFVKYGEIYDVCVLATENHAIIVQEVTNDTYHVIAEDLERIKVIE